MDRFLTFKYYFAPLPDPGYQWTKATLALGLLLIILGFAAAYYRRRKLADPIAKKILKPYPGKLKTYGFLVLFLLLVREQGLPYLSMRIWWFVLLGFFLYSLIKLASTYHINYESRSRRINKNQKTSKYLPKKKH